MFDYIPPDNGNDGLDHPVIFLFGLIIIAVVLICGMTIVAWPR